MVRISSNTHAVQAELHRFPRQSPSAKTSKGFRRRSLHTAPAQLHLPVFLADLLPYYPFTDLALTNAVSPDTTQSAQHRTHPGTDSPRTFHGGTSWRLPCPRWVGVGGVPRCGCTTGERPLKEKQIPAILLRRLAREVSALLL